VGYQHLKLSLLICFCHLLLLCVCFFFSYASLLFCGMGGGDKRVLAGSAPLFARAAHLGRRSVFIVISLEMGKRHGMLRARASGR